MSLISTKILYNYSGGFSLSDTSLSHSGSNRLPSSHHTSNDEERHAENAQNGTTVPAQTSGDISQAHLSHPSTFRTQYEGSGRDATGPGIDLHHQAKLTTLTNPLPRPISNA